MARAPVDVRDDDRPLLRVGGVCGLAIAISYPVIIALFLVAGTDLPVGEGGQAWLDYLSGHEVEWWVIVGLSVLTDVLWIPVAWGLYRALRTVDGIWPLVGAGLMVLFVMLELTTSWPIHATLIDLSNQMPLATTEAQRASIVAAADYASVAQSSPLLPTYAILIPGLGVLAIGAVMWKGGPFGRAAASLAIAAGVLNLVAVAGSPLWSQLDQAVILGSLLSAVWFAVVGVGMIKLGKPTSGAADRR